MKRVAGHDSASLHGGAMATVGTAQSETGSQVVPDARRAAAAGDRRRIFARTHLLILLGSNMRPQLHLDIASEVLDRVFPLVQVLGRCRAAAIGGHGIYHNRLLLCRVAELLATPSAVDRYCRLLEATVARRVDDRVCPIDIDPFLIAHADGRVSTFERTDKVLALLAAVDPAHRLGLPDWVAAAGSRG